MSQDGPSTQWFWGPLFWTIPNNGHQYHVTLQRDAATTSAMAPATLTVPVTVEVPAVVTGPVIMRVVATLTVPVTVEVPVALTVPVTVEVPTTLAVPVTVTGPVTRVAVSTTLAVCVTATRDGCPVLFPQEAVDKSANFYRMLIEP